MTDVRTGTAHKRTYTRVAGDQTETVTINVGADGRVRITADNLHALLEHLGYRETTTGANP